ncbi:hypothetical protein [uncultured Vagococcus sp.]|uniref:hypothetical protein n=1 Tax=uncultured Vagococcus sp. TaxID=189676 RepID=UPI00258E85E7|nr:hypothetical protein [uncultured Vagococcus sp.]
MKYLKRNSFFIISGLLVVLFLVYSYYFTLFYNDVILYGEFETSNVIKLLLIVKYRGSQLAAYFIFFFLLMTLYLFNFLLYYFKIKSDDEISKKEKVIVASSLIVVLMFFLYVSSNILWIIFIPLTIFSLTITYVSYLVSKQIVGKKIMINEEVIGIHGPFITEKEMNAYIEEINNYNDLSDIEKKMYKENNKYFIEFYK